MFRVDRPLSLSECQLVPDISFSNTNNGANCHHHTTPFSTDPSLPAEMRSERARIRTFATWPSTGAKTLARYGFHASREGDCIRCAFCGLEISGFSSWREVKTWHWQVSGNDCPLLREQQNKSEETEAKVLISRSYSKENAIGLYSNPRTERLQLLKSTTSAELGSHMCLESRNSSLLLPESVSPEIASPVKTSHTTEVASLLRDSGTASEQLVSQWLVVSDFQGTESAGAEETGCPQRRADSARSVRYSSTTFPYSHPSISSTSSSTPGGNSTPSNFNTSALTSTSSTTFAPSTFTPSSSTRENSTTSDFNLFNSAHAPSYSDTLDFTPSPSTPSPSTPSPSTPSPSTPSPSTPSPSTPSPSTPPPSTPSPSTPPPSTPSPSTSSPSTSSVSTPSPSTPSQSSSSPASASGVTWADIVKTAGVPHMVAYQARLQSFKSWPLLSPSPRELARAGLFHVTTPSLSSSSSASLSLSSTSCSVSSALTSSQSARRLLKECSPADGYICQSTTAPKGDLPLATKSSSPSSSSSSSPQRAFRPLKGSSTPASSCQSTTTPTRGDSLLASKGGSSLAAEGDFRLAASARSSGDSGTCWWQDSVRCFWCGTHIHRWQRSDDPVLEHARLSPDCRYVMELLGHQLHRDVIGASAASVVP